MYQFQNSTVHVTPGALSKLLGTNRYLPHCYLESSEVSALLYPLPASESDHDLHSTGVNPTAPLGLNAQDVAAGLVDPKTGKNRNLDAIQVVVYIIKPQYFGFRPL